MNTREREVMDALATALAGLKDYAEVGITRGPASIEWATSMHAADEALAAYDALLAEGSASSEGSERRPIADEVVLPDLPTPAVYDRGRFGVMFSAEQMLAYARAALESALPHGLPAGSDAVDRVDAIRMVTNGLADCEGVRWVCQQLRELPSVATAEQPSCRQDARDVAVRELIEPAQPISNYQWPNEKEWNRFHAAVAAIAAQQRQGGSP